MTWFVQIYGLLSVFLRGITLSFESLTIGGIVFLVFIAGPVARRMARSAQHGSQAAEQASLRWIARWAVALMLIQAADVAADVIVLMQSGDMTLRDALGANFAIAGMLSMAAAAAVLLLAWRSARSNGDGGHAEMLLPAGLILAASVMTSHAMARMDHRIPLALVTALHQGATAAWIGGLPYLLIALKREPSAEVQQELSARFSRLAIASVSVLALAGIILATMYIGSWDAVYGTSYGMMVVAKVALLGLLLFLGALNYRLVHRGDGARASLLSSLRRFGETEIGIGFTVILVAASLTSLPPATDILGDRVSAAEIAARVMPELPPVYAQHQWAGFMVLLVGLLALVARTGRASWTRNWPLVFLALAVFLFLDANPEIWPTGPVSFWSSLSNPEVFLHRVFVVLVTAFALSEWRVQTGRSGGSSGLALLFPVLVALAGGLLLTHSHNLNDIKEEQLEEFGHIPMAILGVTAGWSRWLEVRLPAENRTRRIFSWVWPVCFVLIGALLVNYREPA